MCNPRATSITSPTLGTGSFWRRRNTGKLLGKTVTIESQQQRIRPEDSEVGRLLADNSKARMILGWRPIVSFEKGLSQTVEWIQSHLDQFRTGIYTI